LLTDAAKEDLDRYAASGNRNLFLKKLVQLEEDGVEFGAPLGSGLTGFRKIIVGDRNWRIVYQPSPDGTEATVWVIGDRDDDECYRQAAERLASAVAAGGANPTNESLASIVTGLLSQREGRKRKDRKRS
jgi:mRNA interferase RelE/StbE